MKFLLDQDVYASTLRVLRELGHDALPVAQIGLSGAGDEDLLVEARVQTRIFVTRDRDFGGLIFVKRFGTGVLYLRILPSTQESVHSELTRVLKKYSEEKLHRAFVVIEAGGHRFRKLQD